VAKQVQKDEFPVSRTRNVKGTRHMAREKVLQVLAATMETEVSLDAVFPHVFYRQFTFDAGNPPEDDQRILRPDEVLELEADVPIEWTSEDIDYAMNLIIATRDMRETSQALIDRHAKNWDLERIALLDRVLMHMAIAELVSCADIPVKVTINEVIELGKQYSTDKSGTFINGILDAIIADLQAEGRIRKSGRGLVE